MGYDMQAVNDPSERGYYRLNIWGMMEMRERMRAVEVLDDETPMPPFPGGDKAAIQAWRSQRSPDPLKVAAWKFESNDGWVVTPEECYLLAHRLRSSDDPWVRRFAEYCAACVNKGGFAVW